MKVKRATPPRGARLTDFERKALTFIRDNQECWAADIAHHLLPDSSMHGRYSNQGHGACRGKASWLYGGSVAGRLAKKGWVYVDYGDRTRGYRRRYSITVAGVRALGEGQVKP